MKKGAMPEISGLVMSSSARFPELSDRHDRQLVLNFAHGDGHKRDRQPTMWVTTTGLPTAASHPSPSPLESFPRRARRAPTTDRHAPRLHEPPSADEAPSRVR